MDIINDFPPKKTRDKFCLHPANTHEQLFVIVYFIHMASRFSFLSHLIKRLLKLAMSFNLWKASKLP